MFFYYLFNGSISELRVYWESIVKTSDKLSNDELYYTNKSTFRSESEAKKFVEMMSSTKGPGVVADFYMHRDMSQKEKTKLEKINKKVSDAEEKYKIKKSSLDSKFFMSNSKFSTCKKCSSKINKYSLENNKKSAECPVCGHSFLSPSALKSLEKLKQRVLDHYKNLKKEHEAIQKNLITREKSWIIGVKT